MTENRKEFRLRYFRTKAVKVSTPQSLQAALMGAKNSLLLQAEHMEETGSFLFFKNPFFNQ